jgi:hypothetical protein
MTSKEVERSYPDSSVLLWDNENIKNLHFDNVNQFEKKKLSKGEKSCTENL